MFSNSSVSAAYILVGVLLFFGLLAAVGLMLANELEHGARVTKRIDLAVTGGEPEPVDAAKPDGMQLLLRVISAFGMFIARSGVLSRSTLAEMTATLEGVGFKSGRGLGLFVGAKILLLLVSPILCFLFAEHMHFSRFWLIVITAGGAACGMLAPETIAKSRRAKHLKKVAAGVPDALDMLVICADAGLALEAGIARVAQEIAVLNPALAMELNQTSQELQIGSDMRHAMDSLGQRTGLNTLKRLATTLAQSLQYGTPLIQALRSLSAELRQEALVKFEERAGRLPTLMTLPMILFILPCVFLVVAGPAIINVMASIKGH